MRKESLITKIKTRNYQQKLSGEIMSRNYDLVYYVADNVGIIGILAYPKILNILNNSYELHVLSWNHNKRIKPRFS